MIHTTSLFSFRKKNNGFTLIELLVAVAISAVVLLAVGQFFISTNRANTVLEKTSGTQQDIRAIMEMMTRDIRMAGLDPSREASNAGFNNDQSGTNSTSISFAYDYYDDSDNPESDGDCDDWGERICYSYNSADGRLEYDRSDDGASTWGVQSAPLTKDNTISSVLFEYFSSSDDLETNTPMSNPSANLSDIQIVRIQICGTISGAYSGDINQPYCFSNTVRLRNM